MRSSRSRMPARLRPNGERTSTYSAEQRHGEQAEHHVEEGDLVREIDAELGPDLGG